MSIVRISNPDQIRPSHVILVGLVCVILLGSCLLTCGAGTELIPDGAVAWRADSLFRAVVDLLNLNNSQPTLNGVAVKSLVFHIGSAVAIVVLGIAIAVQPRRGEEPSRRDTLVEVEPERDETLTIRRAVRQQLSPLGAGQILMLLYVGWSFASAFWSNAPDFALAGSAVLAMQLMWAFALGLGLNRTAARTAGYALVAAGGATAILAILYHRERNPTLRASYPIGNPTFLAACLIPGLVLGVCLAWGSVHEAFRRKRYGRLAVGAASVVSLVVMGWAFHLADSRGPLAGLVLALAVVLLFALGRRGRKITGIAVLLSALFVAVVSVGWLIQQKDAFSVTGRSASMRVRLHGWGYATDLASRHILHGYGQAGFVLNGDALAAEDVLRDPEALEYPIRHAHNEFLEVWADLGSIGLVLLGGGLLFTLWAAMRALPTLPSRSLRWMLIGLAASLFGLIVEETVGVGLRLPGVPTVFYTVLGLVWAMSSAGTLDRASSARAPVGQGPTGTVGPTATLARTAAGRWGSLGVALLVGLAAAQVSIWDFRAARRLYEISRSLTNLEWERALEQSDFAHRYRLPPQRRLMALDVRCATRHQIARYFQSSAFRRLEASRQAGPASGEQQQLLALANEDAAKALRAVREAHAVLDELYHKAPDCWNAGWLRYRLRQIEFEFALARNDEPAAAHYAEDAAAALERELQRRPFDPTIAVNYATITLAKLELTNRPVELEPIFDLLARPLRYRPVPSGYFDYVRRLTQTDWFREQFPAVQARSLEATRLDEVEEWPAPLAPERLCLCAVVAATRHEYAEAEMLLQQAARLYERLPVRAPVGTASCYSLLADARFFRNPADPQPAIDAAETALKWAPPSHIGRQIIDAVAGRLVAYHLALGHEDFVRSKLLPPVMMSATPVALDRELASRYAHLCRTFLWREPGARPKRMDEWLARAIALSPADPAPRLIKAEVALRDGGDGECAKILTDALAAGTDPTAVFDFVQSALPRYPQSEPLLTVWTLLHERYGAPQPPPASQPADVRTEPPALPDATTNGA